MVYIRDLGQSKEWPLKIETPKILGSPSAQCSPLISGVARGVGLVSGQRQGDVPLPSPGDVRRNPRHSFRNPCRERGSFWLSA